MYRIRVSVDGGIKTGRDVAVAALLGAEEFVFGTRSLIASGCVMARECHTNNCPTGVATQREDLRELFTDEPEHIVNYVAFMARELREIMADLGLETVDEMVGRVDLLEQRDDVDHPKTRDIDLSAVLAEPDGNISRKIREQDYGIDDHPDHDLLADVAPAIESGESVTVEAPVTNEDRAVGAVLSNRISRGHGEDGLADGTLTVDFEGVADQSFGAFLQSSVRFDLSGSANDYLGKGLSAGRLTVTTPEGASYDPGVSIVVGNVALYGATDGECYVNGRAGERFGVRNSGALVVIEGISDHGCEYMTGSAVAVLGSVRKNFATGMSGGVAYVLSDAAEQVNRSLVTVEHELDERDRRLLLLLVENHAAITGSDVARTLLGDRAAAWDRFTRVMLDAYRRAVEEEGHEDIHDAPPASRPIDDDSDIQVSGVGD